MKKQLLIGLLCLAASYTATQAFFGDRYNIGFPMTLKNKCTSDLRNMLIQRKEDLRKFNMVPTGNRKLSKDGKKREKLTKEIAAIEKELQRTKHKMAANR